MFSSNLRRIATMATLLFVLALPASAADDDEGGETSTVRENACTQKQIDGGYEDIDGRCQLTGWNWVDANGKCVSGSCGATGCVTSVCQCVGSACVTDHKRKISAYGEARGVRKRRAEGNLIAKRR